MVISSPHWMCSRACTLICRVRSCQVIDALGAHELFSLDRWRKSPYSRIFPLLETGSIGASGRQFVLKMPKMGSIISPNALCRFRYAWFSFWGSVHRTERIDCAVRVSFWTINGVSTTRSSPLTISFVAIAPSPWAEDAITNGIGPSDYVLIVGSFNDSRSAPKEESIEGGSYNLQRLAFEVFKRRLISLCPSNLSCIRLLCGRKRRD